MSEAGGTQPDAISTGAVSAAAGGCVVFLVAETPGMDVCVADGTKSKAETIATALNSLLKQLSDVPDLDVAIVGYRGDEHGGIDVGCRWDGALKGELFIPARELAEKTLKVEKRVRKIPAPGGVGVGGEQTVEFPVWYEPTTGAPAPPAAAYEYCQALLSSRTADSKPPLVVAFIDEVPEDGSLSAAVWELYALELPAGPPMVCHVHLGSSARVPAILCPASDAHLAAGPIREVFGCTSFLADPLAAALREVGMSVNQGARAMIYHAALGDLIRFLAAVKGYARFKPLAASQQEPQTAPVAKPQAALVVLLLDRSVDDPAADESRSVLQRLEQHANDLLGQFARRGDDRMCIGVVSYGVDAGGQPDVQIGLPGLPGDQVIIPCPALPGSEIRTDEVTEKVSNGIGGLIDFTRRRPIFLETEPAVAEPTALAAGVEAAVAVVSQWRGQHPDAVVPPVVLHLTGGRWDAQPLLRSLGPLSALAGPPGGVLLYHLVVTRQAHRSLAYIDAPEGIDDPALANLWENSGPLLGAERLAAEKRFVTPGSRGFVVNGKFDLLLEAILGAMPGI